MIVVTGGAGFIGSNLVHELNAHGINDILIVDSIANEAKAANLRGAKYTQQIDKAEFRRIISEDSAFPGKIEAVLHQGACSNTLEDDSAYMMDNNFQFAREVMSFAIRQGAPFVYASTAAVYGLAGPGQFAPVSANENPLNIYGASKLAFDNYVRERIAEGTMPATLVGLRYFNVYGPRELHKGRNSSLIHQWTAQIKQTGKLKLFTTVAGSPGGQQSRDFVYVRDLARINMFFAQLGPWTPKTGEPARVYRGVVNAGSGTSRSYNELAQALMAIHGQAVIEYEPIPEGLRARYQHFTQADLTTLRELGCGLEMTALEDGIAETFAVMRAME